MDCEEGTESSSNDSKWSHVADDILDCILQRLRLCDYLRIQAVCSSWRAIVAKAIADKWSPPSPELPLVLLQTYDRITHHFFFLSLSTERLFKCLNSSIDPPNELNYHHIYHGTVKGWMIMSEVSHDVSNLHRSIFFFNPITNASVHIPARLNCHTAIRKIVASSNPSDPDCVVVCLFSDFCNMAFCRICDESWTSIEGDKDAGITFLEVEILDGKVYALTHRLLNSLLVYDLQEKPIKPKILAEVPAVRPAPVMNIVGNIHYSYGTSIKHLAVDASCGELLLIYALANVVYARNGIGHMNILKECVSPPQVTAFQVFKWDNESGWVDVKNLGNRLLFLSTLKSFVVSSVGLNGPKELVRENSIFVTFAFRCVEGRDKWQGMHTGRHCLTDGRMEYFDFETSSLVTAPVPTWFIPNVW